MSIGNTNRQFLIFWTRFPTILFLIILINQLVTYTLAVIRSISWYTARQGDAQNLEGVTGWNVDIDIAASSRFSEPLLLNIGIWNITQFNIQFRCTIITECVIARVLSSSTRRPSNKRHLSEPKIMHGWILPYYPAYKCGAYKRNFAICKIRN